MNYLSHNLGESICLERVRVWRWDVRDRRAELERSREQLSPGERRRLSNIVSEPERNRFLMGRYALRAALSQCTGLSPERIRFRSNRYGALRLSHPSHGGWRFSLSHSGDLVYAAVARGVRVGVDVERLRPGLDWEAAGELCLSHAERRGLDGIPGAERRATFHRLWCRKEAVVKAAGKGMHIPLHTVDIGFPAAEESVSRSRGWTLVDLETAPGYVAALAVGPAGSHAAAMELPQ